MKFCIWINFGHRVRCNLLCEIMRHFRFNRQIWTDIPCMYGSTAIVCIKYQLLIRQRFDEKWSFILWLFFTYNSLTYGVWPLLEFVGRIVYFVKRRAQFLSVQSLLRIAKLINRILTKRKKIKFSFQINDMISIRKKISILALWPMNIEIFA